MNLTTAKCSPLPQDKLHSFTIYEVAIQHDNLCGSVSEIISLTTYYTFPGCNRNQSARATLLRMLDVVTLFVHILSDSLLEIVPVFNTKLHPFKLFSPALTIESVYDTTKLHASNHSALLFLPKLPIF